MNIFERIKQFFNRNKTKLLPAGNEIIQAPKYEITPKREKEYSETLSPKGALEKNWIAGQEELIGKAKIEENSKEREGILTAWIDSEFKPKTGLERMCIYVDESQCLNSIIESYFKAKLLNSQVDYHDIGIDSEEIILLITHLQELERNTSGKNSIDGALVARDHLLTSEQQETFESLTPYSASILSGQFLEDASSAKSMLDAIAIYGDKMPDEVNDDKYYSYKRFLRTEEGKKCLELYLKDTKQALDVYSIVGKKEAYRMMLLRTTDPDTQLPPALIDTYESTEDYMIRSAEDIYRPLMTLVDNTGATEQQKLTLKNIVEEILRDKKMVIPFAESQDENSISCTTIEKIVGIKLNNEARILLSSFVETTLSNRIENEKHSIIIATHRNPAEEKTTSSGTCYDRFVNGQMLPAVEVTDEDIKMYAEQRKDKNIVKRPLSKVYSETYRRLRDSLGREPKEYEIEEDAEKTGETPEKVITDHAELEELISGMDYSDKDSRDDYIIFESLLNTRILDNLPNEKKLSEEEKEYVSNFEEYKRERTYLLRALLTPESLRSSQDLYSLNDEQEAEVILEQSAQKVTGLHECIDEIVSKRKIPTIKERYEKILVQAILNQQISEEDYFVCMKTINAVLELNKVKLSPEESLAYVIRSEGGTPSNSRESENERDI